VYLALVLCLITGFLIGLIHRATYRFNAGLHLIVVMAVGIVIPLVAGSILRLAGWISGLFYYYVVLACAINIAFVIFFDKALYGKRWLSLIVGLASGLLTMLIANFKLDETYVSSFYLFVLGLICSPGLFLSAVIFRKRKRAK